MDVSQIILWPDVISNLDCNSDRFRSTVLAIDLQISSDQSTKEQSVKWCFAYCLYYKENDLCICWWPFIYVCLDHD